MWKYKEEYKLDRPETIGEKDYTFDLDNYREWLELQLTECRKQLSIANVVGQSEQFYCANKDWCGIAKGRYCYKEKCEDWSEKQ